VSAAHPLITRGFSCASVDAMSEKNSGIAMKAAIASGERLRPLRRNTPRCKPMPRA
jgi:hypothetical protein